MTQKQMKQWIDNANYEQLLVKWRFAAIGDPFFQGEVGDYYREVMKQKREQISDATHVSISKSIE